MNKAELVEEVKKQLGGDASKAEAERALDAVLESIKQSIKTAGKSVKMSGDADSAVAAQLIGFGTFSVKRRGARTGLNPQTKEKIKIKAAKQVKFKPGAGLSSLV